MNKLILLFLSFCLASCIEQNKPRSTEKTDPPHKQTENYTWTKLLDSAAWKKSYNFQLFSIRDTLWTFHFDGNWYSTDGKNWTLSVLPNAIGNLAFLDYVQFKDAIYGIGYFNGNIENATLKNEIYKTTDYRHWETISTKSNLPRRFFYHPFVFNGKIWLIGGEDNNTQYSDIWNSADAVKWVKQKDDLPFGKRSRSQIVQLNNKLFLLDNDVWSSTDGLTWQKETDEIVKGQNIFGYEAIVFDGKIWLLGCNRNGRFSSKVFTSTDGRTWNEQDAPWSPRGGIAATVYKGKIYMTGGKYGGTPDDPVFIYSNDVWMLEKEE